MRGIARIGALLCVLTAMLAASATADAASLRASGGGYLYTSAAGETNDVEAFTEGAWIVIRDYGANGFDARTLPKECSVAHDAESFGVRCKQGGKVTLTASLGAGDDWWNGTYMPPRITQVIDAGDGHNVIEGGAGDDTLTGGDGNDTIYGDRGDDTIYGGNGFNWLRGNAGNDTIYGGDDFDFMFGDNGKDWFDAGGDDDYVYGGNGDDYILGGAGNDLLVGDKGADKIYGGDGADEIQGGKGKDLLDGGAGNDMILARDKDKDASIVCGAGTDVAYVDDNESNAVGKDCETVRKTDIVEYEWEDLDTQADDESELYDGVGAGFGAARAAAGSELLD